MHTKIKKSPTTFPTLKHSQKMVGDFCAHYYVIKIRICFKNLTAAVRSGTSQRKKTKVACLAAWPVSPKSTQLQTGKRIHYKRLLKVYVTIYQVIKGIVNLLDLLVILCV